MKQETLTGLRSIENQKLSNLSSGDEYYLLPIHYDFRFYAPKRTLIEQIEYFKNKPLPLVPSVRLSYQQEFRNAFNLSDNTIDAVSVIFLIPFRIYGPHVRTE